VERGYRVERGEALLLHSPQGRDDLRIAASACVFHRASRSVLLGRRRTSSWNQYWAFPGGGCEPGETLEECARRELCEETSVVVAAYPLRDREVFVGTGDGEIVYSVTNFLYVVDEMDAPQDSDELHSEWFTLEEARALRPMAAGTRRILRTLAADLAK
jgi:ADP-ribose pyrophosphatase YjhB (NUDIX family)